MSSAAPRRTPPDSPAPGPIEHRSVASNGHRFHVAQAGPADGPLVLLLHGFPEFWYGWRHQIGWLAARGFRVWAPDQRGYNLSDRPRGVEAYRLDHLADDVLGLVEASGRPRAHLVGHDWGGVVAWRFAERYPLRLDRLAILNAPHPAAMRARLSRDPGQALRSAYALFFQLPRLPEALSRAGGWALPARALRATSRPGTFSEPDLALYREAWSRPGAFRAMLNWYRAAFRHGMGPADPPPIEAPTLVVWGARDSFLRRALAEDSRERCTRARLEVLESAGHWLHHEEPERVNGLLRDFLA